MLIRAHLGHVGALQEERKMFCSQVGSNKNELGLIFGDPVPNWVATFFVSIGILDSRRFVGLTNSLIHMRGLRSTRKSVFTDGKELRLCCLCNIGRWLAVLEPAQVSWWPVILMYRQFRRRTSRHWEHQAKTNEDPRTEDENVGRNMPQHTRGLKS